MLNFKYKVNFNDEEFNILVSGEFVQLMFPNAAEIVSQLKKNFNSVDDVERIFKTWDLNGDNAISFTELQVIKENSQGG